MSLPARPGRLREGIWRECTGRPDTANGDASAARGANLMEKSHRRCWKSDRSVSSTGCVLVMQDSTAATANSVHRFFVLVQMSS